MTSRVSPTTCQRSLKDLPSTIWRGGWQLGAVGGSKALCAPIWTTLLSVYRLSLSFYMDSLALFRQESQPETEMVSLLSHPRVPAGKPTGNGNGVAASIPTCSGRRQNAKPVQLHLHIGQNRKPETEMMAPQSPRDRKWNRWLFLTSFCRQTLPENCNLGYWPDISYCK